MTEFSAERNADTSPVDEAPLSVGKLPLDLLGDLLSINHFQDSSVVVGPGIGCDAAAVTVGKEVLVLKSDPITFAVDAVATYLIHVNANDLAVMGATPRWMLITALLPAGSTTRSSVTALFADLKSACNSIGVSLIGGHTEITAGIDRPILVGMMVGTASEAELLKPGQARSGDRLLLTKSAGIEGAALLAREKTEELRLHLGDGVVDDAMSFLEHPGLSILPEALLVRKLPGVHAMHDPTEGGVATAVREIAIASKLGAVVSRNNIAVLPATAAIADYFEIDPLGMLSSGALLASVDPQGVEDVETILNDANIDFRWIGKMVPEERGFHIVMNGIASPLPHFLADEVTRVLDK